MTSARAPEGQVKDSIAIKISRKHPIWIFKLRIGGAFGHECSVAIPEEYSSTANPGPNQLLLCNCYIEVAIAVEIRDHDTRGWSKDVVETYKPAVDRIIRWRRRGAPTKLHCDRVVPWTRSNRIKNSITIEVTHARE
jgi:hypothetical protein